MLQPPSRGSSLVGGMASTVVPRGVRVDPVPAAQPLGMPGWIETAYGLTQIPAAGRRLLRQLNILGVLSIVSVVADGTRACGDLIRGKARP